MASWWCDERVVVKTTGATTEVLMGEEELEKFRCIKRDV